MHQLTNINQVILTMTSREIAELTGKQHKHVLVDIAKMLVELEEDEPTFRHIYFDSMNREQREYQITKELTEVLLTGYSAKLRRAVIARWKELEAKQAAPVTALPQDYIQALESLLASKKSEQIAIEQRDHAIKTKAQIGDKRQATSMAKVAISNREVAKLKDQLGFSARHATIMQVEAAVGREFSFVELRRWCQAHEVVAEVVPDKRYPKGVKAWPASAWSDVYGVDLADLFGEVTA